MALQYRDNEFYVHYVGTDKRLDEWVDERLVTEGTPVGSGGSAMRGQKRKRKSTVSNGAQSRQESSEASGQEARAREAAPDVPLTEEELDMQEHSKITATRNFDKVNFGQWQIKTW